MPAMTRRTDVPMSVTGRALTILAAFDAEHPALTLSQISVRSGLPLSTTHRMLGEFIDWGALVRGQDRRYRIGPGLTRLARLGLAYSHVA